VDPKVAAVMSSLGPGFASKPPPKAPAPRPSARATPGLGDKMRSETSRALESALGEGRKFATGLEKVVKAAAATVAALPTARIVAPNSRVRTPVHAPAPPPMTPEGAQIVSLPKPSHPLVAAARALPGQLQELPGRAWGAAKRPLALGALGAAGALAYGLHQQNQHDRENQRLVYAPLQGAMM